MNYCKACQGLNVKGIFAQSRNNAQSDLHSSFDLLYATAEKGCDNCKTFQDLFHRNHTNLDQRLQQLTESGGSTAVSVFLQTAFPKDGERSIIKFHVQIGSEPERPGIEPLKIPFRVSQSWESAQLKKQRPFTFRYTEIDHDLGSDQNFGIAKDWIQACCDEHDPTICPALEDVELPTRLIDVGTPENISLRLIKTSKDQRGRYLALSHCWGPQGTKRLVTDSSTLSSRLAFINQDDMPPNFSDAVIITRRLGYRYLWIDSLCIIQDSKSDWEIESQNMGRIYTNSALTLAAAAATSSDGGMLIKTYQPVATEKLKPSNWFLGESTGRSHKAFAQDNSSTQGFQPQPNIPSCRIKIAPDDEERNVILEPLTEFSDLEENWFRCTVLGPLALRGWCLQEKLLSRRILYYGNRQIYWQCASARKAADGEDIPASAARSQASVGNAVSDWPDILSLSKLHQDAISSGSLERREAIETKIYKTWHNVLFLYINRRLSFNSDRLPGLAGMATLIQEMTGDRYTAGFWLKYLKVSLLWTCTKSILKEDAPRIIADGYEIQVPEWEKDKSEYSGPSWSWCSVDINDVLDFWADHDECYRSRFWRNQDVEIVDVNVDLVSANNIFGQVKAGRLVLKGYTYERWDTRALNEGRWRIYSSFILGFCPHSPWNRERGNESGVSDRAVLWDYWPRQHMSPTRRALVHVLTWLWDLLVLLLWQGLGGFLRERRKRDCGACRKYLCMHVLSILDKEKGRNEKYEVDLWSLVLERVDVDGGGEERYRRVGIARKLAYVDEAEVREGMELDEKVTPKIFKEWEFRKVVVI